MFSKPQNLSMCLVGTLVCLFIFPSILGCENPSLLEDLTCSECGDPMAENIPYVGGMYEVLAGSVTFMGDENAFQSINGSKFTISQSHDMVLVMGCLGNLEYTGMQWKMKCQSSDTFTVHETKQTVGSVYFWSDGNGATVEIQQHVYRPVGDKTYQANVFAEIQYLEDFYGVKPGG